MYLKMHYYYIIYNILFIRFFSCFHNYVSKKCIARHVILSFHSTHTHTHIYIYIYTIKIKYTPTYMCGTPDVCMVS